MTICPKCSVHQGHLATCPTQLDTLDKRIAYVAWRWNSSSSQRDYQSRGFSDDEIRLGMLFARDLENEYDALRGYFGDPAYGSWPKAQRPVHDLILAASKGKACFLTEAA